jgi:hypothetical protein
MKIFKNLFNRKKKSVDLIKETSSSLPEDYYNICGKNGEKRVFKIYIGDLSDEEQRKLAEEQISQLMSYYKKDVDLDNVKLPDNDENLYFDKDYWFPIKNKD